MSYQIKGPLEVGVADSQPRLFYLKGPVSISAKSKTREMTGTGTLHSKFTNVISHTKSGTTKPAKAGEK